MARTRAGCFPASAWPAISATCARTVQNLEIVRIDAERQLLMIKGSVPGSKGGNVVVSSDRQGEGLKWN